MTITFKPSLGTIYTNSATAVSKIEPVSPSGDASPRHPEDQEARLLAQNVAHEYNEQLFGKGGKIMDAIDGEIVYTIKGETVDVSSRKRLLVIT